MKRRGGWSRRGVMKRRGGWNRRGGWRSEARERRETEIHGAQARQRGRTQGAFGGRGVGGNCFHHGDFDARGELGMDEAIPAGYTEVRYVVSLESPAPRADIDAVLTAAERTSPYIDVFGRALRLRRELRLNGAEA